MSCSTVSCSGVAGHLLLDESKRARRFEEPRWRARQGSVPMWILSTVAKGRLTATVLGVALTLAGWPGSTGVAEAQRAVHGATRVQGKWSNPRQRRRGPLRILAGAAMIATVMSTASPGDVSAHSSLTSAAQPATGLSDAAGTRFQQYRQDPIVNIDGKTTTVQQELMRILSLPTADERDAARKAIGFYYPTPNGCDAAGNPVVERSQIDPRLIDGQIRGWNPAAHRGASSRPRGPSARAGDTAKLGGEQKPGGLLGSRHYPAGPVIGGAAAQHRRDRADARCRAAATGACPPRTR